MEAVNKLRCFSLWSFQTNQAAPYLYTLSKAASRVMELCFTAFPAACHRLALWIATLCGMTDAQQNGWLLRRRYVSEATEPNRWHLVGRRRDRGPMLRGCWGCLVTLDWADWFECRRCRLLWWLSAYRHQSSVQLWITSDWLEPFSSLRGMAQESVLLLFVIFFIGKVGGWIGGWVMNG